MSTLSKDAIIKWRARVGEEEANKITQTAAKRGTKVHSLCEKYIFPHLLNQDVEIPETTEETERAIKSFEKIKRVIDNRITTVHNTEFSLYSDQLRTAGTCDLFCLFDGKPSIVDFKTSLKYKKEEWIKGYLLQATTYALMIYERKKIVVPQIVIIVASDPVDNAQVFVKKTKHFLHETIETFETYHAASALSLPST
jgi:genome maintenance exonuclease 1